MVLDAGLSDGLIAVVKRGCPTCELVVPVLAQGRDQTHQLAVSARPCLLAVRSILLG